jgi:Holliday junction resolvasome RuvABC endonuclease subunit
VIILAFDPGTTSTGWAIVNATADGSRRRVTFRAAGAVPSEADAILALFGGVDVVAVEKLKGFAYASKGGASIVDGLVASSRVAGLIVGLTAGRVPCVEMTAHEWRKLVCGNGAATDAKIAATVPRLVEGFPKRSNVHVRDATGLAVAVGWTRPIAAPGPTLREMLDRAVAR